MSFLNQLKDGNEKV